MNDISRWESRKYKVEETMKRGIVFEAVLVIGEH